MNTPRITFNTNFARNDLIRRARHGAIWTDDELKSLQRLYFDGASLRQMAETLARPADGVINKLRYLDLIEFDQSECKYYRLVPIADSSPTPKETLMNEIQAPTIETKTFIDGEDASKMTDKQIFQKIAALEAKIDTLSKIRFKPKKLEALIATMTADIEKLVEFVDARP